MQWILSQSPAILGSVGRALRRGLRGLLTFPLLAALGAVPTLEGIFPSAVQVGSTNPVTAVGKFEPWPPHVWVGTPGIRWEPQTNSGSFRVEVAADAAEGPHLIRFYNADGASAVRFLLVDRRPQQLEVEPNDDFLKPQSLTNLPASLNGRLEKSGDVDSYAVTLKAGETLVAALEGYVLQSPFDGVLRLLNDRRVQVAWNHDDGLTLDPRLAMTAPSAGVYVLQVFGFDHPATSDVRFAGNAKCIYRLKVSTGIQVRQTLPLGIQRGAKTSLRLFGWAQPAASLREIEYDGTALPPGTTTVSACWSGVDEAVTLPVGDGPELVEQESGGTVAEGGRLPVPSAVSGAIGLAGDEDRFTFSARKDEKFIFEVASASLGFPLDGWLRLEDAKRKELARSDDTDSADPRIEWTAPLDGEFALVIGNLIRRGGPDHLYRLSLIHPHPSLKARLGTDVFSLEAGRTNEVKVAVTRKNGFAAKLRLTAEALPQGVAAEAVDVPDQDGDVVLKLVAQADAKPIGGPFQIVLSEKDSGVVHRASFELAGTGENNGVPQGFRRLVVMAHDRPWLTVIPPAPAKQPDKAEKK